ncbi:hypothetical protein BLOT_000299 [Blomia tropicalis]|nr:hypothetical protein BLOT_000299 [Blomia tropicalis]
MNRPARKYPLTVLRFDLLIACSRCINPMVMMDYIRCLKTGRVACETWLPIDGLEPPPLPLPRPCSIFLGRI